ncbi:MAG: hypothetical protein NT123_23335 [Proteobacteria bacterium]|nr:hypothetical protein [Pseudomonadota bacterium]
MKTKATKLRQQEKWPPESLKRYIKNKLKRDAALGLPYKRALKRLLNPDAIDLKLACEKLRKKSNPQQVEKYLEQVCDCYLDIEMYRPIPPARRHRSRPGPTGVDGRREVPAPHRPND